MRLGAVLLIAAIAAGAKAPAWACAPLIPSPPPPPRAGVSQADAAALGAAWTAAQLTLSEERERQQAAGEQRRLYEAAGSVVLARFDRMADAPTRSFLVPLQWLKGEPVAGELAFELSTWTTCRAVASVNGVHGVPGEVFLVYLTGSVLLQAETLDARPVSKIIDPETLAILSLALTSPQ